MPVLSKPLPALTAKTNLVTTLEAKVQERMKEMTLEEKVGQMIMPALKANSNFDFKQVKENIQNYHVGGYHFVLDEHGLHKQRSIKKLINWMQNQSQLPLLIASDFEGGLGFYFNDATRVPRAMAIGATGDTNSAYEIAQIVAKEARALGVHINFYPDVDINSNSKNPIINIRSFGAEPDLVSSMAVQYIRGLQQNKVIAVAKHFPGHGNTSIDSHIGLPTVNSSLEELKKLELKPFQASIDEGVQGIMSAHVLLPKVDEQMLPATMSKPILTNLLKEQMGFKGLLFTDAMMMGSIAKNYPNASSCVMAVKAGADVILYPVNVAESYQSILKAVKEGEISEERINESVKKILLKKYELGLLESLSGIRTGTTHQDKLKHEKTASLVMERAITLVKDSNSLLPLELNPSSKVLIINLVDKGNGWREGAPGEFFKKKFLDKKVNLKSYLVTEEINSSKVNEIIAEAKEADVLIVAGHVQVSAFKGSIDFSENQIKLLKELSAANENNIFVMFGNPYVIAFITEFSSYVLAYECYPGAETAAAKAITGEVPFKGKLPVEIDGFYKLGHYVKAKNKKSKASQ
ncbi:MAG: glycoside hydrolase family 3 N-terminal domain-containing protein [Candidatus Caenarcaniphilales bacterium]|nr:glycoside hydrolase family 3 N-terminal domain-containing protein [Candidatus Caenarcaniphilales bacterium]